MNVDGTAYRTIWLAEDGKTVEIIDQTRLPHHFTTVQLNNLDDAAHAISEKLAGREDEKGRITVSTRALDGWAEVRISDTVEASALGAGMTAAYGAGWYPSIVAAAEAMSGETIAIEPNAEKGARYGALLDIYRDLYQATSSLNSRMVQFAEEGPSA